MHVDLSLVLFLCAAQSLLLGLILLAATRDYSGRARASLRLRGWALLAEGLGYTLAGLRGRVSDWLSVVAEIGLILLSNLLTVYALRMLMGLRQYPRTMAAIGSAGWLLFWWFAMVQPDFRMRVIGVQLFSLGYALALAWPLRRSLRAGGSLAERILLGVAMLIPAMQALRFFDQWLSPQPTASLLQFSALNLVYMGVNSLLPLLLSIGLLLMYNEAMHAELKDLARIDPLTGVNNRRALYEGLERRLARPAGRRKPLAALVIDVDHFKAINDVHGHAGGDKVLVELAASLASALRSQDLVGRIGGEEFVVLAPDADLAAGLRLGERLRRSVAALELRLDGRRVPLTISVGVAVSEPGDHDPDILLRRADLALYEAKRAGRDRVAAALNRSEHP